MTPQSRRIAQFAYVAVVVIGFATYIVFSADFRAQLLTMGTLDGWASGMHHGIGATSLFTAFVVSIFFSIPAGPLFYIAFGYFYGAYEGALIADMATTAGSAGAFFFFRAVIPPGGSLTKLDVRNVFATLLLLRSSPWIPNPLITVFCSSFDVGIVTFTLATFIGTMPLIFVYTLAASRLHGDLDISVLYSTEVTVAFGLLGAISLLGFLKPLRIILDYLKAIRAEVDHAKAPRALPGGG